MRRDPFLIARSRRDFLRIAALGTGSVALGCGANGAPPTSSNDPTPPPSSTTPSVPALDAGTSYAPVVDTPESIPESSSFGLGVASGDVTSERALLWTRYDGAGNLGLRVWRMHGTTYERVAEIGVAPADGRFAQVDVERLL